MILANMILHARLAKHPLRICTCFICAAEVASFPSFMYLLIMDFKCAARLSHGPEKNDINFNNTVVTTSCSNHYIFTPFPFSRFYCKFSHIMCATQVNAQTFQLNFWRYEIYRIYTLGKVWEGKFSHLRQASIYF